MADSDKALPLSVLSTIRDWVKGLIPTKVSDLNNDAGYITGYTETDPTVPSWAKAATKPSYTASEVGAQETLVSGTNIKTVNGNSLLGSGNITIEGGDISASVCKARGTDTSATSGTSVTKVTLNDMRINTDTSNYSFSSGGIKVAKSGLYEVSGSTMIIPNNATTTLGTYIRKGTAFSSAEEQMGCLQGLGSTGQRAVPTGPVLINIDANQIIFLATRCRGTAGTVDASSMSTFLQIKRIGEHT